MGSPWLLASNHPLKGSRVIIIIPGIYDLVQVGCFAIQFFTVAGTLGTLVHPRVTLFTLTLLNESDRGSARGWVASLINKHYDCASPCQLLLECIEKISVD